MNIAEIKQEVEREIKKLQQVAELLDGLDSLQAQARKMGHVEVEKAAGTAARRMSVEGRARIAEAQRKRWRKMRREKKAALLNDVKA